MRAFAAAFLGLLLSMPLVAHAGQEGRYALVVGSNTPLEEGLSRLSFADDDAVRTSAVLELLGTSVRTLAELDEDTRRLFPGVETQAPTRSNVLESMDALVQEGISAARSGSRPVLYFVFSGHGSYDPEGRGYLHLVDGRLTLRDLFHRLIVPTTDKCDVVIVLDSCNAEFLVKSRGYAVKRRAAASTLRLEDYDHVGVILSASSSGQVKEWGRLLGGIFSHQFRSAILGGADQNCDGKVTFQELAAFLDAANADVSNPELRLTPYVRPPLGNPDLPVASPDEAVSATRLLLDEARPLRLTVLDESLVTEIDVNLSGTCPRQLVLAPNRPHTVRFRGEERLALGTSAQPLSLSGLPREPDSIPAARGTDDYLNQHLFNVPYDADYYARYASGPYQEGLAFTREVQRPWYRKPWAWASTGLGVLAAGTASVFMVLANEASDKAASATWAVDIQRYNDDVTRYNLASGLLWGTAGVALTTGVLLFVFHQPVDVERVSPQVKTPVSIVPDGLRLEVAF